MDSPNNQEEMINEKIDSIESADNIEVDTIIDLDKVQGDKPNKDITQKGKYKPKDYSVQINEQLKQVFSVADAKYEIECKSKDSPYIEVAFANQTKQLYYNVKRINLRMFEYVIVQTDGGVELGTVISCGNEAVEKFKLVYNENKPEFIVIRRALKDDINKLHNNHLDEISIVLKAKEFVETLSLEMKVTAAEWQFDRHRLTIFFTAPSRVDFRALVKELARFFRTRIELRQISTREEARRMGGMGPCGLNICCTSFNCSACEVTPEHAKDQLLPNNSGKLSGYCGRLKCCLLYEHDIYVDILRKYPPAQSSIITNDGKAILIKIDVFKEIATLYFPKLGIYKSISGIELLEYQKDGKIKPPIDLYPNSPLEAERKEAKEIEV